jgi:hypothetical protein
MSSRSGLAALAALLLAPGAAHAVDPGRLELLAREAADVLAPAAAGPSGSIGLVAAVLVAVLLASAAGTWIGLRSHSVTRVRERHGWRELTYRFRSPGPVRVDGDVLGRLAGILDEVEVLGARLKGATLTPATAMAGAAPRRLVELAPIRFRRGADVPPSARWSPEGPLPARPPAKPTEPAPHPAAPRATEESASPPVGGRVEQYRAARRLLREGLDRQAVRARTGLKLAEIELLRCHPGDES